MEKFRRNEKIVFHEDILKRTFDIAENKIMLQFHYGKNDIRPTVRVYKCPPRPDYGCEIQFNEDDNPVDEVCFERIFRFETTPSGNSMSFIDFYFFLSSVCSFGSKFSM